MTIELRLLTTADVEDLYPRLRLEDKEECIVLGSNPREALLMGAFDNVFTVSKGRAYALTENSTIIGAIGFTSSGYLWALSTKFSRSQLKELWLRTKEITHRLLSEARSKGVFSNDHAPHFHNLVHTRNKVALRWLQKSGVFVVFPDREVEVGSDVFYPFRTLLPFEMKEPAATCAIN